MRNNGEAMRKRPRSTKRPSEHSERLERLVRRISMRTVLTDLATQKDFVNWKTHISGPIHNA